MANPNESRSFNNIQNSRAEKRKKNKLIQQFTLMGIVGLAALTVCTLMIMAIGGIIGNIAEGLGWAPNNGPDNEKIRWDSITVTTTDTQQGDLVLVNKTHVYTFPATNEHLSEIYAKWYTHKPKNPDDPPFPYVLSGLSAYMDTDALNALDAMLVDFNAATGKTDVQVRYAYRTLEEQGKFSVQPGYSDHHTGLGVQLKYYRNGNTYAFSTEETYNWFYENCHKYGFVVRYPADKTEITGVEDYTDYFRFVGVAHATYMKEKNLCMEEYVGLLKGYTDKSPLKINAADGNYYEVYYVAVDGSATVKVPANYAYNLSGTNDGGVVITVSRSQAIQPETETSGEESGTN